LKLDPLYSLVVEGKLMFTVNASRPKFKMIPNRNYDGNLRYEHKFSRAEINTSQYTFISCSY